MAIDNTDMVKRLKKASAEIKFMSCYGYHDSDGQSAADAVDEIDSVIKDLETLTDDWK